MRNGEYIRPTGYTINSVQHSLPLVKMALLQIVILAALAAAATCDSVTEFNDFVELIAEDKIGYFRYSISK